MYRILAVGLARGLLRVAGRRGRCHPVCLLPGPPGARAPPCRGAPRGRGSGLVPLLAALAWSSRPAAAEQERRGAGGAAAGDAEAEIIQLLKRAKLCIMKDEPEEAELILHDALHLAHKSHNTEAITYTYDLMANLAFIRGQLENAEKLFKATMSYLLGAGMQQEDNAIIEISLKLATIYAAQSRQELALAGYEFCISTLEEKIERERELSEDVLSALLKLPASRSAAPPWQLSPVITISCWKHFTGLQGHLPGCSRWLGHLSCGPRRCLGHSALCPCSLGGNREACASSTGPTSSAQPVRELVYLTS
ncbi:tetratricopeptide repeat protein 19, mitochondrial isoform X2 [Bubalus kerabau]|uniref:tetratricopeptide repeat protein 19, mitochondrial isoform X2 n=1 Tax=Bubalus carabanensis TaxID=3119969 RepID=UPI00244EA1B1|nr:tetratricopeptide repeat protein 19, mitochondrial isoform X2 [Bubalus carabanensis]